MARWRTASIVTAAACLVGGCSSAQSEPRETAVVTSSPQPAQPSTPAPSSTPIPPVLYFNLTEEDALLYLNALMRRIEEARHDGDLGALEDLYMPDSPAREEASAVIIRNFRRRLVDRTHIEAVSTQVLRTSSQLAVFRQVRLVEPCVYTYAHQEDVTADDRIVRQVVRIYMADENLNWKIEREVVLSEEPTGARVRSCP
ncbi:MAG TPA: hypothetical protein VHH92_06695 [Actinomycetota bacterium]|nr:hypothetical protein [Actinomycetota bacterium]